MCSVRLFWAPRTVHVLCETPCRTCAPSSCFLSRAAPTKMEQLLHSGYFMSEFHVPHTRLASYLCPSILQGHPRSLSKVGDTDGSCDPQAPLCLAVCCLLSAWAGQAGSLSRPPTSLRPCLALPGLAPSDIRVIMASGDGGYRLGVRSHPSLFFQLALQFQERACRL